MTFVGHSIVGLSIAAASMQNGERKNFLAAAAAFVLFANFPDFAFRLIPYYESHSLFTVLAVLGAGTFSIWILHRRVPGLDWRLILLGNLTVLSHLLLDTFYNHGLGLALLWPLSAVRTALPIPWLSVMQSPFLPVNAGHVKVWALELVTFAPILLLAAAVKMISRRKEAGTA